MPLVDNDSWDVAEQDCFRLLRQLQMQVEQLEDFGGMTPVTDPLTVHLNSGLEQLRKDISLLKQKLEIASVWQFCPAENLERRSELIQILSNEWKQAYEAYVRMTREETRPPIDLHFDENEDELASWQETLDRSDPSPAEGILSEIDSWQEPRDVSNRTPADGVPSDVEELKRRQIEMMQDQNRGLETLSQTISRQRELASQLGQEVDDQNDVLDNLANTMERVESGVQRETGNISQVNRRDGTCGYWVVILGLMVAIVVVAFL